MIKHLKISTVISLVLLTGCASNRYVSHANDPLEPLNRGFYKLNKTLDALYIKPASKIYDKVIPETLRKLVSNFFNNVNEIPNIANSLLQAKYKQAIDSTARLTINSTLGIGGLFDVAAKAKLNHQREDFGKTLAVWGYKNSNYLVLPIVGPTTVRDGIGFCGNAVMTVPYYFKPKARNRYEFAYVVNRRSELQETESFMTTAGVDEYVLVRDAYLQHRSYTINDKSSTNKMLLEPPE